MEKVVGEGIGFERIRRVTGYLAGDVKRFNNYLSIQSFFCKRMLYPCKTIVFHMDTRQQMKKNAAYLHFFTLLVQFKVRLFINPQSDSVFPLLTGQVDK